MNASEDLEIVGSVSATTHWLSGSSWGDMVEMLHGSLFDQAEDLGADTLLLQGARVLEGEDVTSVCAEGIALRGASAEALLEIEAESPGSLVPLPRPS